MEILVHKGKVVQVGNKRFPVHKELKWVRTKATEGIAVGYEYREDKFFPPEEELPTSKQIWERDMNKVGLSDDLENIIDALEAPVRARIAPETMDKYTKKKNLREGSF